MKKVLALILALTFCIACFAACTGNTTEGKKDTIRVGTGSQTGTYYAFATASLNAITTDAYGFEVVSTGGSQANIEGIEDGDYQFATVQNDVMNYAYQGINGFNAPITSFSAVACLYPEIVQLVATASSGIKTVADLKGKMVGIGASGSGTYYNAIQIIEAAGLDIENDLKTTAASFTEAATGLKDGSLDAAFVTAGTPTTAITELATSTDVVVIDLGEDVINALVEEYPFYSVYELTSSDYDFVEETVKTVAIMAVYVVTNEMSEERVYEITKNLWENEDVKSCHAKGAEMDINTTLNGLGDIPLHPGAEKYYIEAGILEGAATEETTAEEAAEETTVEEAAEETTAEEAAEETTAE